MREPTLGELFKRAIDLQRRLDPIGPHTVQDVIGRDVRMGERAEHQLLVARQIVGPHMVVAGVIVVVCVRHLGPHATRWRDGCHRSKMIPRRPSTIESRYAAPATRMIAGADQSRNDAPAADQHNSRRARDRSPAPSSLLAHVPRSVPSPPTASSGRRRAASRGLERADEIEHDEDQEAQMRPTTGDADTAQEAGVE